MTVRRAVGVGAAIACLAACAGDSKAVTATPAPSTPFAAQRTAAATAALPVYPLTGLTAADPGRLTRPALVVKIDNTDIDASRVARPQSGLNQADVVYEEMIEGTISRMAAIFQSQDSDLVGPIRSARTTDVGVFSTLRKPLFAWSGANADFEKIIRGSAIVDAGYGLHPDVYRLRDIHPGTHQLYSSTAELFSLAPPDAMPPLALFEYRNANDTTPPTARAVGSIHVEFGPPPVGAPVDWTWNAEHRVFVRDQKGTPHVDENDVQITAPNVVVVLLTYHDTGYVDSSGHAVPEADLVGTGECWILTDGTIIKGRWSKTALEDITTYSDATGASIKLTPGRTWVELAPTGSATITG